MEYLSRLSLIIFAVLFMGTFAHASPDAFHKGDAIHEFGDIADVRSDQPFSKRTKFKVVFDVAKQAEFGKINRNIVSMPRFINMHRAQGVQKKNIKLALVLHGGAAKDVTKSVYYEGLQKDVESPQENVAKENANAALVQALLDNGVQIYVCGQTAAYYDIKNEHLLPAVKMSLSAMTAHALLQQKGYTLNPFKQNTRYNRLSQRRGLRSA